jgi:hypothetical protein
MLRVNRVLRMRWVLWVIRMTRVTRLFVVRPVMMVMLATPDAPGRGDTFAQEVEDNFQQPMFDIRHSVF